MHHDRVTDPLLDCPSRRGVLRALAGVGVTTIAAGVLAACSSSEPVADGGASTGGAGADPSTDDAPSDGASTGDAAGGGAAEGEATLPLADVPVGQAVVVDAFGSRVVVAQPTAGEVVAFSAACTHQGTIVEPEDGLVLLCPNHGSRFDVGDGAAVLNGPAEAPLPSMMARIEGEMVVLSA